MSSREQKIVKVGLVGIILNIVLSAVKGLIGFLTGSISISVDALNNLTDVFSALVTVIGTKLAHRPPDAGHPHGHHHFEDLTALLLAIVIIASGVGAIVKAAPRIANPAPATYSALSLFLIFLAVIAKFVYSRYASAAGQKLHSLPLRATATDSFFDALTALSTLVSALLHISLQVNIEGYTGVVVGAFIIKNGVEILLATQFFKNLQKTPCKTR